MGSAEKLSSLFFLRARLSARGFPMIGCAATAKLSSTVLVEARINFESSLRFTAFFLSVRRGMAIYRNDFPRPTTTRFAVLKVEAFTLILLTTYPSLSHNFAPSEKYVLLLT